MIFNLTLEKIANLREIYSLLDNEFKGKVQFD